MRTRTPDEPARPDALDEVLESLGQLFADLGLVVRILQERRAAADRLRRPLAQQLEALPALIAQVLPLL
jgi:hypothetical protein